jgi:hypothetical protein
MSKKEKKTKIPINTPDLIEQDDQEENDNWLKLEVNNSDNFIKVLSANLELNEQEFPRLFEVNDDVLPNILKKIITFGYQCYFPEPTIEIHSENINDDIDSRQDDKLTKKLDIVETLINKLTGVSNNSKKIGIFGENYIHELISKNFIGMSYQQTGETDHSGDGLLTLSNGSEILVEIKNYSTIVNDDEINKFTLDMKTTKRKFGLFISIATKINKMKTIDLKTFVYENQTYYQFYISHLNEDLHRLEVGILLLQLLSEYANHKNKEYTLDETIKDKLTILVEQINENEKLRGYFLDTEKDIRNSLNNFYQKLRDNHMDMENKIKNIFTCLKDNNITNLPDEIEENELIVKYKDSKINNILKKTIDYLDTKSIEYTCLDKEITLKNIGCIKIFKDKLELQTKTKLKIPISNDTWKMFEEQIT